MTVSLTWIEKHELKNDTGLASFLKKKTLSFVLPFNTEIHLHFICSVLKSLCGVVVTVVARQEKI